MDCVPWSALSLLALSAIAHDRGGRWKGTDILCTDSLRRSSCLTLSRALARLGRSYYHDFSGIRRWLKPVANILNPLLQKPDGYFHDRQGQRAAARKSNWSG